MEFSDLVAAIPDVHKVVLFELEAGAWAALRDWALYPGGGQSSERYS